MLAHVLDHELLPPTVIEGPSHEAIAARAHERYERRGAHDGLDLEDWLEAERELLAEAARFTTAD